MYSSVHATAGTLIVLATYAVTNSTSSAMIIGGSVAFLAHDVLDRFGEKSYGDLQTSLIWEVVPLLLFAVMAYLSGLWQLYFVGWIAGNLMDIIDKKLYLAILFPKRVSFMYLFPCHRRTPNVQLTQRSTQLTAIAAACTLFLITALIG